MKQLVRLSLATALALTLTPMLPATAGEQTVRARANCDLDYWTGKDRAAVKCTSGPKGTRFRVEVVCSKDKRKVLHGPWKKYGQTSVRKCQVKKANGTVEDWGTVEDYGYSISK